MPVRPPIFRPHGARTKQQRKREADSRRGSARERGYTSRWDRAARLFLGQHPLCLGCEAIGFVAEAVLVDHVEPHRGDMEKFWNSDMWQPSCDWHHNAVKQHLEGLWAEGRIILGDLWLNSAEAVRVSRALRPAA